MYRDHMKLHVLAFGFAFGIVGAISMFIVGLSAMGGYGVDYVGMMSSLYIGYRATLVGSLIGALWGFVDCFIFGIILAGIYNCLTCCKKRCRKDNDQIEGADKDHPHEQR